MTQPLDYVDPYTVDFGPGWDLGADALVNGSRYFAFCLLAYVVYRYLIAPLMSDFGEPKSEVDRMITSP